MHAVRLVSSIPRASSLSRAGVAPRLATITSPPTLLRLHYCLTFRTTRGCSGRKPDPLSVDILSTSLWIPLSSQGFRNRLPQSHLHRRTMCRSLSFLLLSRRSVLLRKSQGNSPSLSSLLKSLMSSPKLLHRLLPRRLSRFLGAARRHLLRRQMLLSSRHLYVNFRSLHPAQKSDCSIRPARRDVVQTLLSANSSPRDSRLRFTPLPPRSLSLVVAVKSAVVVVSARARTSVLAGTRTRRK